MKIYKNKFFLIFSIIAIILIIVATFYILRKRTPKIPNDAKCIAEIYQGEEKGVKNYTYHYYYYEFYKKGNSKYIVRKIESINVGPKAVYVEPTVINTKILKKSDMKKIEEEIQNEIDTHKVVEYIYYDNNKEIVCSSMQEFCEKLF